jgi:hypothetical protein
VVQFEIVVNIQQEGISRKGASAQRKPSRYRIAQHPCAFAGTRFFFSKLETDLLPDFKDFAVAGEPVHICSCVFSLLSDPFFNCFTPLLPALAM